VPVKTIQANGGTYRLGRNRPSAASVAAAPPFQKYALGTLPPPPASVDYTSLAATALSQMYGNDQYGDCVEAEFGHTVGVWTANAGDEAVYTEAQVLANYSAITGFVVGDPNTDNGTDEVSAMNYWVKSGMPGPGGTHAVMGYLSLDATNQVEVQQALYLFENCLFGVELPEKWISPFPSASGFTWDLAGPPDLNNGHAPGGFGYSSTGVKISTWGMLGTMTWRAVEYYAAAAQYGTLFTMISEDALARATGRAPNGLDWAQLVVDFDAAGGNLPIPAGTRNVVLARDLTPADAGSSVYSIRAGNSAPATLSVKIGSS
jgi:hypothetical protein